MKKEKLNIILPEKKGIQVGDVIVWSDRLFIVDKILSNDTAYLRAVYGTKTAVPIYIKGLKKLNRHAILKPSRGKKKGFYFNLVGDNDRKLEVIATSEIYTTKAMARKTLKKYFPSFKITER